MSELATSSPSALSPLEADRFDHPHPDAVPAQLSGQELAEFVELSMIEEVQYPQAQTTCGEIVGVVLLRRRLHDGHPVAGLVAQEIPTFGIVMETGGHVGWMVQGLRRLTAANLEQFSRKSLELFRGVTVEMVLRDSKVGASHG